MSSKLRSMLLGISAQVRLDDIGAVRVAPDFVVMEDDCNAATVAQGSTHYGDWRFTGLFV